MHDLKKICDKVIAISKEAGAFIRNQKNTITSENVEIKSLHSYVTYVDKTSEQMIVKALAEIIPEAGFIAEEGTSDKKGEEYNWIIDPLDGTTNFIHGLEPFSVSIALQYNDEIIIGVVYEIGKDECFYSYKGSQAFLNKSPIKVSNIDSIENSLIATGFPYEVYDYLPKIFSTLEYFMRNSQGVRRLGSAATDLVYVACGRFDAFYETELSSWDVAAGAFILKQAGGKVSDISGKDNYLFGKEIVSSNSLIFDNFLSTIQKLLNKT